MGRMLAEGANGGGAAARVSGPRLGHLLPLFFCVILAGACTSVPPQPGGERLHTLAFRDWQDTALGTDIEPRLEGQEARSGFALLGDGASAFNLRHRLTVMAERSIDAQYYIWESDTSGRLLAADLLKAAMRGVRVRVLIDDIHTGGRDFHIAALADHPNIEVRVFNPFVNREARMLNWLFDLPRLNHRMHNKAWIVDGAAAIVGGRNIGDVYFGINTVSNFRDLDVLAVGPVVQDVATSFDLYWNSDWAQPIRAMATTVPSPARAAGIRQGLIEWAGRQADFPFPLDDDPVAAAAELDSVLDSLLWADARVYYDRPEKPGGVDETPLVSALWSLIEQAGSDVLIEASYFIATREGVQALGELVDRGVNVRVLTNSLATTDLVIAHAGYARYRQPLLAAGVDLYEFRPDATGPRRGWSRSAGQSKASLHSKAMVVDHSSVVIGSFNPTPRSVAYNTEIGILIESPELAREAEAFIQEAMDGRDAWRLRLSPDDGSMQWTAAVDGHTLVLDHEPEVGRWRRFKAWLLGLLPIERLL